MTRLYRIATEGVPRYAAERDGQWRLVDGDIFGAWTMGAELPAEGHTLLAPVLPSKIVCVGLNYKDHAAEQHKPLPPEPLLFIKPSTSVIGPGEAIQCPAWAGRIDHESELGLVIHATMQIFIGPTARRFIFHSEFLNGTSLSCGSIRLSVFSDAQTICASRRPCTKKSGATQQQREFPSFGNSLLLFFYKNYLPSLLILIK